MNYGELANRYLEINQKLYKSRINYNVRDFVRGFAIFLDKQEVSKSGYTANIALITENNSHLTGGRYYAFMMAAAIKAAGFDITIYTNAKPDFLDFFADYDLPKIEVVPGVAQNLEGLDIRADIYIGSPISGNLSALRNAKKYNKPSYLMVFDPFPMMEKYLNKSGFVGWTDLIKEMSESDTNIISLCESTNEYIYPWLDKTESQVIHIYPNINSKAKEKVPKQVRGDFVLFISRLVPNKKFDHVLAACKDNRVNLKVISSTSGIDHKKLVEQYKMADRVEFIFNASEEEKFRLIKQAQAVISGAIFEGFGMYVAEAIDCGTPFVGYDYPTFREIRDHAKAKNVYLAKLGDYKDLGKKLKQALKEKKFVKESNHFGFESMINRVSEVFEIKPKIGVVTIALNEEQFIAASLKSVIKHPSIQKVAVIEGAVDLFPTHKDYLSVDETRDEILGVMKGKYGHKIVYERYGQAKNKSELRNRALSMLHNCNYILVLDADELYTQEDLDKLVEAIKENPSVQTFVYPFNHFWKNTKQITTGGQWDVKLPRFFKFSDKGTHWTLHQHFPVNSQGIQLDRISRKEIDIHCYHFGYCKDEERVTDKLTYYKNRDKNLTVKDTYSSWKKGQETQPTHGGGIVSSYSGTLPEEIRGVI